MHELQNFKDGAVFKAHLVKSRRKLNIQYNATSCNILIFG